MEAWKTVHLSLDGTGQSVHPRLEIKLTLSVRAFCVYYFTSLSMQGQIQKGNSIAHAPVRAMARSANLSSSRFTGNFAVRQRVCVFNGMYMLR